MTTEGTMAVTVVATDAATFATEIVTVDAINATTMTATVDVAHRADVPGVGGGTINRGHPGVVRVSSPSVSTHLMGGTR